MEGCEIYTTAEITLMEAADTKFSRVLDDRTKFKELAVSKTTNQICNSSVNEQ